MDEFLDDVIKDYRTYAALVRNPFVKKFRFEGGCLVNTGGSTQPDSNDVTTSTSMTLIF